MNTGELIEEYEQFMHIKLSERERLIFIYAYFIGKNSLDKDENLIDSKSKAK